MSAEDLRWYEADVLMADLTVRRNEIRAASEEEIERRMRSHYTEAAATWCMRSLKGRARRPGVGLDSPAEPEGTA